MGQNFEQALTGMILGGLLGNVAGSATTGIFGDNPYSGTLSQAGPLLGLLVGSQQKESGGGGGGGQSPMEQMLTYSMIHPGEKIPIPPEVLQGKPLINMPKQQQNPYQMLQMMNMMKGGKQDPSQAMIAQILAGQGKGQQQQGGGIGGQLAKTAAGSVAQAGASGAQDWLSSLYGSNSLPGVQGGSAYDIATDPDFENAITDVDISGLY